jgi:hypothetical protein
VTKHFNNFTVLLVGRLFCGVATSLLNSAFESWLVAEHTKVCLLCVFLCTQGMHMLHVLGHLPVGI